jgi:hypothetical protein
MRRLFRDTPSLLARIGVVRLFNLSPSPPNCRTSAARTSRVIVDLTTA